MGHADEDLSSSLGVRQTVDTGEKRLIYWRVEGATNRRGEVAMRGHPPTQSGGFDEFSFERFVPETHLVRKPDSLLALGFVRERLAEYDSQTGRPSIDLNE